MVQQLIEPLGPTEPVVRNVAVSVLDVSPLTPAVRALLRDVGHLSVREVAEFYGPSPLPRLYSAQEASELVEALERLGVAARSQYVPEGLSA